MTAPAASTSSTFDSAVNIAASIGEFSALFSLIISIAIAFILIIIGCIIISKKREVGKGVLLIVIAFLIVGISYLYYYFVTSNKSFAAIVGVATVADIISGGNAKKVFRG
jgi:hypothetical protein